MRDTRAALDSRLRAPRDANRQRLRESLKRRPPAHLQQMVDLYGEPDTPIDNTGQVSAPGVQSHDSRIAVCDSVEHLDAHEPRAASLVRGLEPQRKGPTVGLEAGRIGIPARQEGQR